MLTNRQSLLALILGLALLVFGTAVPAAQVNINTADAATLARDLKGVGIKRAQAIVDYRQKHGPFKSPDELALVKGIGPAVINNNREFIRTDARAAAPRPAGGAANPAPAAPSGPPARKR